MDTLVTQRTQLRRFTNADLSNMIKLESNPEIMKFTPARIAQSPESTRERLLSQIGNQLTCSPLGIWAAETRHECDFIGWFMLLKRKYEYPELGFMIVEEHWGKGYATEIAKELIDFGFSKLKLSGVNAVTDHDNLASKRVLTKLGFRLTQSKNTFDDVLNQINTLDIFELLIQK